eukprot:36114-Prorocentrum_minimum.AAC.1
MTGTRRRSQRGRRCSSSRAARSRRRAETGPEGGCGRGRRRGCGSATPGCAARIARGGSSSSDRPEDVSVDSEPPGGTPKPTPTCTAGRGLVASPPPLRFGAPPATAAESETCRDVTPPAAPPAGGVRARFADGRRGAADFPGAADGVFAPKSDAPGGTPKGSSRTCTGPATRPCVAALAGIPCLDRGSPAGETMEAPAGTPKKGRASSRRRAEGPGG